MSQPGLAPGPWGGRASQPPLDPAPEERLTPAQAAELREAGWKRCALSWCAEVLPLEAFARNANENDGLKIVCRTCDAIRRKGERVREQVARSPYSNNSEKARAREKRYREANPEKGRESAMKWQKANPEKVRKYARVSASRRRARVRNAPVNDLTAEQVEEVWAITGGLCYVPGCEAEAEHLDHIVPRERGGGHTQGNVAPCCAPCNLSKGAKLLEEWLPTRGGVA